MGKHVYCFSYKGYDRTKVALSVDVTTVNYDEPAQHVDGRCVTAPEAMWRLRGNELQAKSHTVECLDVNLPGQNVLKYDQLAAYFALCAQVDANGEIARSLYYAEVNTVGFKIFSANLIKRTSPSPTGAPATCLECGFAPNFWRSSWKLCGAVIFVCFFRSNLWKLCGDCISDTDEVNLQ